jgi:hypothetical protein
MISALIGLMLRVALAAQLRRVSHVRRRHFGVSDG